MDGEKIKLSGAFLTIVTGAYFREENCAEELEYARSLKKPIIHLIKEGTEVPDGFILEGETSLPFTNIEEVWEELIKIIKRKVHN